MLKDVRFFILMSHCNFYNIRIFFQGKGVRVLALKSVQEKLDISPTAPLKSVKGIL